MPRPRRWPTPAEPVSPEVRAYLDDTLQQRAIVIPQKDRHQYSAAFKKVANARNSRRLAEKLWDQFALGKHQEFGHNLRHARVHAAMAVSATRLKKLYRPMPETPFVYYPLHVPADMALTLRSPEYLDQVATIDFLLRTIPDIARAGGEGTSRPDRRDRGRPPVRAGAPLRQFRAAAAADQQLRRAGPRRRRRLGQQQVGRRSACCSASRSW